MIAEAFKTWCELSKGYNKSVTIASETLHWPGF